MLFPVVDSILTLQQCNAKGATNQAKGADNAERANRMVDVH